MLEMREFVGFVFICILIVKLSKFKNSCQPQYISTIKNSLTSTFLPKLRNTLTCLELFFNHQ